jgi:hypothetical protein
MLFKYYPSAIAYSQGGQVSIKRKYTVYHLFYQNKKKTLFKLRGRAVVQWLKHYATNRQVAGSIPDGIIGIFQ